MIAFTLLAYIVLIECRAALRPSAVAALGRFTVLIERTQVTPRRAASFARCG